MSDDYMPEEGKSYKLLDPGFDKVFVFGNVLGVWPYNTGYIIADSFEDAYEELQEHAYEVDGECDHGNDPELAALIEAAGRAIPPAQDEWEACWRWVDEHCDCESMSRGYVWMVDSWYVHETTIKPLDLVKALRAGPGLVRDIERLDALIDWYEED